MAILWEGTDCLGVVYGTTNIMNGNDYDTLTKVHAVLQQRKLVSRGPYSADDYDITPHI